MSAGLQLLGGAVTLVGAALLVVAFRHSQAGRRRQERRVFTGAVVALAAGSVLLVAGAIKG